MPSNPKPRESVQTPALTPDAAPAADVKGVDAGTRGLAHASPARALQDRLVREMTQPNRSWRWHSAGLVLTAILALWAAGMMLNAGF
jgi:hypothetical protein